MIYILKYYISELDSEQYLWCGYTSRLLKSVSRFWIPFNKNFSWNHYEGIYQDLEDFEFHPT